ncbi:hypothetical protein STTU_2114 [Streptomyces sp. Tu6071]|nr:hypothetical protein STTU_2114 [Streptomyces sp. Tu6071]
MTKPAGPRKGAVGCRTCRARSGGELTGLDARHETGERRGSDRENRTGHALRVTHGDDTARGDEIGGHLHARAPVVATVGGLEPVERLGRHDVPFRTRSITAADSAWGSDSTCR